MTRILTFVAVLLCAMPVLAQEFSSYEEYQNFLDKKMKNREFSTVIRDLGGADEYTEHQLDRAQAQLRDVVPFYLTDTGIIKRVELENGFSQELRGYWNDKNSYIYFYALLHERDYDFVVVQFYINTSPEELFTRF
ncbi:hypothetical protein SAMN05444358_101748 [Ruegeria halocynthiae]|uniref:DUF3887 domain-containing protein n=1 Tax=Ruegeria halocynthiae TaxID=985054 RepID=A0A1H2TB20_9RHOB|nr:hypothetical protein [Ruegeria halocynthiae]SDW41091.1 hypothetical protein SAMN05444358_101748 [Ruegeria halocynthiae]